MEHVLGFNVSQCNVYAGDLIQAKDSLFPSDKKKSSLKIPKEEKLQKLKNKVVL